jgi:hypothetical protein
MNHQDAHHHLEVTDGERTVATAEVTAPNQPKATAVASLQAEAGHLPPGVRARLVDAVLDLPTVQGSDRVLLAVPRGDAESLHRLQERCAGITTRAAGATSFVEADPPNNRSGRTDN